MMLHRCYRRDDDDDDDIVDTRRYSTFSSKVRDTKPRMHNDSERIVTLPLIAWGNRRRYCARFVCTVPPDGKMNEKSSNRRVRLFRLYYNTVKSTRWTHRILIDRGISLLL